MAFAGFLLLRLGASGLAPWGEGGGCGCWVTSPYLRSGSARRPSVWRAGLVAGLLVGQAFGVLLLPGFGVGSYSPQVPGTQRRR